MKSYIDNIGARVYFYHIWFGYVITIAWKGQSKKTYICSEKLGICSEEFDSC